MDLFKKIIFSLLQIFLFTVDTVYSTVTVQLSFTIISVSIIVTKIQPVMKRGGLSHFLEDLEISLHG